MKRLLLLALLVMALLIAAQCGGAGAPEPAAPAQEEPEVAAEEPVATQEEPACKSQESDRALPNVSGSCAQASPGRMALH